MSQLHLSVRAGLEPPPPAEPDGEPADEDAERDGTGLLKLFLAATLCVALAFGVIRPFVGDVLRIASASMAPTLQAGDRVLANKLAYRVGEPSRGDVVVFEEPARDGAAAVKRVAAVEGDRVFIRDGVLVVNGARQDEPYLDREAVDSQFFGPVTVPADSVFVLGDNRADSRDSRHYGPVPEGELTGEVLGGL